MWLIFQYEKYEFIQLLQVNSLNLGPLYFVVLCKIVLEHIFVELQIQVQQSNQIYEITVYNILSSSS